MNLFKRIFIATVLLTSNAVAQEIEPVKNGIIVALVPLSGEKSVVGKNMLGAMELAIKDLEASEFQIKAVDTEADTQEIVNYITKIKPNAIIGPAYSSDVQKLLPYLNQFDTCVISFSNDAELSGMNCLVLMGFMPESSIGAVTKYANSKGYIVSALLPNNKYGKILERSLIAQKYNMGAIKYYEAEDAYDIAAKFDEIKALGVTPLSAVLIPELAAVQKLKTAIKDSGMKLLGSSQLEDERIYNLPEFQGALFASAPKQYRSKFEDRYRANYDAKPLKISALAYDATAFAYTIASSTFDHKVTKTHISDPSGFYGITGYFKFNQDGTNARELSIFEIRNGVVIETNFR